MVRIAGINIPEKKHLAVSLTYIKGIGISSAMNICKSAKLPYDKLVSDLAEEEILHLREALSNSGLKLEGDLRREISTHIKRLKDIGCYRGLRHRKNMPVRGQNTHSNARVRRPRRVRSVVSRKR